MPEISSFKYSNDQNCSVKEAEECKFMYIKLMNKKQQRKLVAITFVASCCDGVHIKLCENLWMSTKTLVKRKGPSSRENNLKFHH